MYFFLLFIYLFFMCTVFFFTHTHTHMQSVQLTTSVLSFPDDVMTNEFFRRTQSRARYPTSRNQSSLAILSPILFSTNKAGVLSACSPWKDFHGLSTTAHPKRL